MSTTQLAAYERRIAKAIRGSYPDLAPSFLRIEQTLSNSQGKYAFDFQKNGNELRTEQKLERNDVFIATQIGMFLTKQETAKAGTEVLQTHPNPQVFGSTSGFTVAHLNSVYSGYLWLKIDTKVVIERMPTYNFRRVGTTVKSASLTESEFNREEYAYTLPEYAKINGKRTNELEINFPTFSGMQIASVDSGYTNRMVVMLFGFLARGAAK